MGNPSDKLRTTNVDHCALCDLLVVSILNHSKMPVSIDCYIVDDSMKLLLFFCFRYGLLDVVEGCCM